MADQRTYDVRCYLFFFFYLDSCLVYLLFLCAVLDFLTLAGPVKAIFDSPVKDEQRLLMMKNGATADEVKVVPYLAHTMTTEPFCDTDYDPQFDNLDAGVYYLVSPKVDLNRLSGERNYATFWILDKDSLLKSDFGRHNVAMATFLDVYLNVRREFAGNNGFNRADFDIRFGLFTEDVYPVMVLGPTSKKNMYHYNSALQVVPHGWIHLLFWRGLVYDDTDDEEDAVVA